MKLHGVIPLTMVVMSVFASYSSSSPILNGWYPCSENTFSGGDTPVGKDAQCAVYVAPLCYPGVCETPKGVNPNVDIFVKRIPATVGNVDTASNVWLLQGGPGSGSTAMEVDMVALHSHLEGAVNVYTMDHRGAGRSTRLDCVAAQVSTTGSPSGAWIDLSEIPACAQDLHTKYGDLASFSVTTAATDLAAFISMYTNGRSTIVYGVSYATMLAERLMHLAPPEVTGYVLDGIVATSGAPVDEFFYFTDWDSNFGEVGDAFLALCEEDRNCKDRFQPIGLNNTLQNLIDQFDDDPNSTCAALIQGPDNSPSLGLREILGTALMKWYKRTLIPSVVYRLQRCSPDDVEVLTQFLNTIHQSDSDGDGQDNSFQSTLLYYLIVYSEMWEAPMPPIPELKTRLTNAKMSFAAGAYRSASTYCAYSKEKSKTCDEFNVSNYNASGIVYKRDQYWNKAATIPSQSSVLLMSGKLDPQTPNKYVESLLKALDGDKKELIAFDYASHGAVWTTQSAAGDRSSETCGMKLLTSYVRNDGDLTRLDKSCVDEMPAFNLTTPEYYLTKYFATEDAYDGVFNSSLDSSS
ncbi:hypothetical protein PHMEG_0003602 [Phytophthora megakarya]|uniref:Uncharacterized protein n=1 Tax=Phytophthora megakarya TaxID=4795 RepID=A0A225WXP2_9STRA|nr:hypothetical protein PHMEG_0003602 [Phytophthora megakarya]